MPTRRDPPWLMRTYSGHTSATASNELYRKNLARGQTGLSVAFDLPTQTGYDPDHPMARGEVGRVGVPIAHLGDMKALFHRIPLEKMNTSMTINATAAWLLALYLAVAESQGANIKRLQGTTQNDILKEYLSRGTYIFPPAPSLRLTTDVIAFTVREVPRWNPVNICSYHLQEVGATPVQEIAFSLSNAIAVLEAVRSSGKIPPEIFPTVVGRISFFVNAGIRFVEEMCKMRAFVRLWDEITRTRFGIDDPKYRLFRYGVQVNSLGLTERQPENNIARILCEMLAVTLSREARARAIQLPAWNEALGLPRPWDQQFALRMQQILAFETDLLEYGDLFAGSKAIDDKVAELVEGAKKEMEKIESFGGGGLGGVGGSGAIDYMKQSLVASHSERLRRIERGDLKVVGINCFKESEVSPLTTRDQESFLKVDPAAEKEQIRRLAAHRSRCRDPDVKKTIGDLIRAARENENIMPASIACARAGVTTGEWAFAMREVFGEYRAPTGVGGGSKGNDPESLQTVREKVAAKGKKIGGPIRLLIGKPGLDGHSNGAEQIAVRARDAGFEVIYQGTRLAPAEIVSAARDEGVRVVGLSILSGSHNEIVGEVMRRMKKEGLKIPVVVGGIVPESDKKKLLRKGVARVYTPKDYEINRILSEIVDLI